MNAITPIIVAVPEPVLKAIRSLAVEMHIDSILTDVRLKHGPAADLEAHQRWRVTEALETLERAAGLRE